MRLPRGDGVEIAGGGEAGGVQVVPMEPAIVHTAAGCVLPHTRLTRTAVTLGSSSCRRDSGTQVCVGGSTLVRAPTQ
jgi:hypothetical protein